VSIKRVFEKRNIVNMHQNERSLSRSGDILCRATSPITKPGPNPGPG
jgi:hypothetical protein